MAIIIPTFIHNDVIRMVHYMQKKTFLSKLYKVSCQRAPMWILLANTVVRRLNLVQNLHHFPQRGSTCRPPLSYRNILLAVHLLCWIPRVCPHALYHVLNCLQILQISTLPTIIHCLSQHTCLVCLATCYLSCLEVSAMLLCHHTQCTENSNQHICPRLASVLDFLIAYMVRNVVVLRWRNGLRCSRGCRLLVVFENSWEWITGHCGYSTWIHSIFGFVWSVDLYLTFLCNLLIDLIQGDRHPSRFRSGLVDSCSSSLHIDHSSGVHYYGLIMQLLGTYG
jgi:hypothetical protein